MFKWYNRWFIFLFAVVCIVLGLRMLSSLSLFNIDKSAGTATQEYEWAIEPRDEEIKYRRHGFDVCAQKSAGGRTAMYVKKGNETIITSQGDDTYGGWLSVNEYGVVYSWNGVDTRYSYAGIIFLPEVMQLDSFYNANPDAPFCLAHDKSGRPGYMNKQRVWGIQPEHYKDATQFSDKHAVVRYAKGSTRLLYILNLDGSRCPCGDWSKEMDIPFGAEINDDMLLLQGKTGRYFLNVDENRFFPEGAGYEDANSFCDGLAAVKENGLWGYVDREGQYRIPPRYLSAGDFSNGYAYVIDQSEQGLVIDHTGEIISSMIGTYAEAGDYADGFFKVAVSNHRYNLADLEGNLYLPNNGVHELEYTDGVWRTHPPVGHPGFFFVRVERRGVFLPQCRKYISCDNAYVYETVVIVNFKNKGTLYDKATGEVLYRCKEISPFYEGLAVAKKGTRQTFIDTQGRELFAPRSVQLGNFSDGLASVKPADGTSGMIANPLIYDEWMEDDNVRASALGIEPIPAEFLSYGEMWDRLAVVGKRIYDAHTVFKTDDPDTYRVDVAEIRKSLELAGYPSEGIVDREHMAVALTALASEYGIVTEGFLMFYGDKAEVTDDCESAMAYISTLCLFDMDGRSILPQKAVSGSEAQAYLLRFFERMIDQARYPFQG